MHQEVNAGIIGKLDERDIACFEPLYRGYIMNDSFTEWLKSCPKEYTWQMNQVTKDRGTYTFFLTEEED
tara:strand:- start:806 stop:1012 length:207 start_codon:yes stop_codon:yes gene_type:complete